MNVPVWIDYTNYRGERGWREIIPQAIYWDEHNQWHGAGYILRGHDVAKNYMREFALTGIHEFSATERT